MFKGEGLVIKNQAMQHSPYLSIYKSLRWHQGYFKWMLCHELYFKPIKSENNSQCN